MQKQFKLQPVKPVTMKLQVIEVSSGFNLECYDSTSVILMVGLFCSRKELYGLFGVLRKEFKDKDTEIIEKEYWDTSRVFECLLNDVSSLDVLKMVYTNLDYYKLYQQLEGIFK